jgi:pyruvate ferredoxin oxidoreductase beta subunit
MAHGIPYVATATIADLHDIEYKVERAMSFHGARYLHILVTCPLGWRCESAASIQVARLATQSGFFPVFEAEYGEVTAVTKIRHRVPVADYLEPQRRYAHLFAKTPRPDIVARLQEIADRNIERYGLLEALAVEAG